MITQHFHDAQSWAAENFGSAQLGHKRRTKRLVVTAHQIADQPEGSLPSKFPWNPLRAVYRLCNRPEVTHHGVTAPHFRLTRQRMDQPDPLLILHDTTELDFTSHQALRGTGPIGDGGGRGFLQHNSLAIHAETGEILGLAFQQIRTRKPCPKGGDESPTSQAVAASRSSGQRDFKASARPRKGPVGWISPTAGPTSSRPCGPRWTWATSSAFRATQDRKIRRGPEPTDKAANPKRLARSLPASVSSTVEVPGRGGRPARTAAGANGGNPGLGPGPGDLEGPSSRVGTDPGVGRAGLGARAACGGRGAAGVDPAQLVAGADRGGIAPQAGADACRPLIEDFHQVEKTGCGEEDLRFETAELPPPMLGVLSVVAVRMLQLRWWGRQHGAAAATAAATTEELEVICRLGHRVQTARDFVHAVAKLGGFLDGRSDGELGWKTLWRGYQRLQDMLMGMKLGGRTPAVVIDTNPHRSKLPP